MKCKKVKKELSAYVDGELNEKDKQAIFEHVEKCSNCKGELVILSQQDEYLRQLEPIKPSSDFRGRFWQKVNVWEESKQKQKMSWLQKISWLPFPVSAWNFAVLFLAVLSGTMAFSWYKYSVAPAVKQKSFFLQSIKVFADLPANSIEEIYFDFSQRKGRAQ